MEPISAFLSRNNSDKCTVHTYQFVYDNFFSKFDRNGKLDILESGIERGGSLAAWKEYLPNARVTGVDITDSRLEQFKNADVEFIVCDIKEYKPDRQFDVIIEDGDHSNHDALWAGINLSKHLKVGGTLFIEDVQEGYMVPFLLWGKLSGVYIVDAIDMRRLTNSHDNFVIVIQRIQ